MAKSLVAIASNETEHIFRITIIGLLSLTNTVKDLRSGDQPHPRLNSAELCSFGVQALVRGEKSASNENQSMCIRKKTNVSTVRNCSACKPAGLSSTGHRANSTKCPVFSVANVTIAASVVDGPQT